MNINKNIAKLVACTLLLGTSYVNAQNDDVYYDPKYEKSTGSSYDYNQQPTTTSGSGATNAQQYDNSSNTNTTDGYNVDQSGADRAYQYSGSSTTTDVNGNTYITNNYYADNYYDDDDYLYTSRLRRYYTPNWGVNYYSNWFTPNYYWGSPNYGWGRNRWNYGWNNWNNWGWGNYGYSPYSNWGCNSWYSPYNNWGWNSWGCNTMYMGWGWNSWFYPYNNWGWNNYGWGGYYGNNYGYYGNYGHGNYWDNPYHRNSGTAYNGPRNSSNANGGNAPSATTPRVPRTGMTAAPTDIPKEGVTKPRTTYETAVTRPGVENIDRNPSATPSRPSAPATVAPVRVNPAEHPVRPAENNNSNQPINVPRNVETRPVPRDGYNVSPTTPSYSNPSTPRQYESRPAPVQREYVQPAQSQPQRPTYSQPTAPQQYESRPAPRENVQPAQPSRPSYNAPSPRSTPRESYTPQQSQPSRNFNSGGFSPSNSGGGYSPSNGGGGGGRSFGGGRGGR